MIFEDRLRAQIREAEDKLKILALFPDLDEEVDVYGVKRLVSHYANDQVDQIEMKNACDCCDDADLLAFTFMNFNGIRVYSDPPSFLIRKQGDTDWGWEDRIFNAGLPAEIVLNIQERLNGQDTI